MEEQCAIGDGLIAEADGSVLHLAMESRLATAYIACLDKGEGQRLYEFLGRWLESKEGERVQV